MCSNRYETWELKEIDRKETAELRNFPILFIEKIEYGFQVEEKDCKDQEKLMMQRRNFYARARKVL